MNSHRVTYQHGTYLTSDTSDIMEFKFSEGDGNWTKIGEMLEERQSHTASVIDFENFKDYCQ